MKGITATTLLLALLAALTANITVQAAPPTQAAGITFSITDPATGLSDAEGEAGTDLSMLVSTQGTDNMQGLQFALRYDPEVVTVASVVSGQVPQNFLFMANQSVPGVVKIALVGFAAAGVSE